MIYVIYHIDTTLAIKHLNTFESGAKRSVTCMNRNAGSIQYAYASLEDYETKVVTTKKVKSLMTGEEIEIPSNTPLSCDPSSETYWSM
jgi:hypothetical protein